MSVVWDAIRNVDNMPAWHWHPSFGIIVGQRVARCLKPIASINRGFGTRAATINASQTGATVDQIVPGVLGKILSGGEGSGGDHFNDKLEKQEGFKAVYICSYPNNTILSK